jgi:hypothetical protein
MYMNLRAHRGLLPADSSFLETLRSQDMLQNFVRSKQGTAFSEGSNQDELYSLDSLIKLRTYSRDAVH